jgi:hypothetical protein
MPKLDDLTALYDRLERLEWHRIMLGGDARSQRAIREHQACGAEAKRIDAEYGGHDGLNMWAAFHDYHTSGPAFHTERAPMPERPTGQMTLC